MFNNHYMTFNHKILDLWLLIIYYYVMSVKHILGVMNMSGKLSNKKIERIDNNCYNCAYFVKHYANLDGTFYLVSGCMHCIYPDLTLSESKKRMLNSVKCEYWQPEKIQIEKRRESIEKYLRVTIKKLQEIAQILKEDSKKNNT